MVEEHGAGTLRAFVDPTTAGTMIVGPVGLRQASHVDWRSLECHQDDDGGGVDGLGNVTG